MAHQGGCLCGAIRYRVEAEPSAIGLCHCNTCRRIASATALPFCTVPLSGFILLHGAPASFRSSSKVVRSFCGRCGSPLTYVNADDPGLIDVMTGSLDDPDCFAPHYSVWTESKLAWDRPNPTCPAFPRSRAEGEAPIDKPTG